MVNSPVGAAQFFLNYVFDQTVPPVGGVGGVPVTSRLREDCNRLSFVITESLAVDIGGGLYSLATDQGLPVVHTNPILQLPGEIAVGVSWNITDGVLATNTPVKKGRIESLDTDSLGASAPGYAHISYTDLINVEITTVENFYFLKGAGLQNEIISIPPQAPQENWARAANTTQCLPPQV